MALKKKKKAEAEVEGEAQGKKKKKKGRKKLLLLLPLALILVAAVGFCVVRFVLPMLSGGGEGEGTGASSKKEVTAYTIGEDTTPSLDTIIEEGEGRIIGNRGPGKTKDSEGEEEEKYTYLYELTDYADMVDRYLDLMLGADEGFVLVDETYLTLEERPELEDEEGALILVRSSAVEGHLFQLVLGWSRTSDVLAVRVSIPEGAIRRPEEQPEPEPASVREQLDALEDMSPAQLTLGGSSMSEYDIYPVEGFVNIDGNPCRRFHFYKRGESRDIVGIIFYSGDQQHIYRMDVNDNTIITELR